MLGLTTAGAGRLKSLRRSKLYDLLAALPLIAWCAFWGARMLPTLVQQMMLVKLFIQTDPTVLPIDLVLSLISNLASVAPLQAFPPVYRLSHNTQPQRRGEVLCLVVFPNAHTSAV